MFSPRLTAFLLLVALFVLPAVARASAYSKVLQTYEQKGTVPPCQFSSSELSSALKGVDTYGAQYFADFTGAIQSALTARADGQCASATNKPAAIPPPRHLPAPAARSIRASTQSDLPAPILLMALLAAIALVIGAAIGLARLRGWEPRVVAASRHSFGEAGYRASAIWADFRDWLRST